jgi:hypothetical protein
MSFEEVTIGQCRLFLGDALEVLATLKNIGDIITDPPYAVPTVVAQGRHVVRNLGDLSIIETAMRVYVQAMSACLPPYGRCFIFCDGTSYPVMFRVLYNAFQTALLIWDKGQIGMGREFRKSHELVIHAWQEGTPTHADGIGRADIMRYTPVRPEQRVHPAQKPVGLLEDLVRVCGPLICDPFMGSASTAIAAILSHRAFIGIEIEPRYFDIACGRVEETYRQLALFPARVPCAIPTQEALL